MILPDFLERKPAGLYCRYGDFYIDARMPVKLCVVSHAHADHAVPGNTNVYCTHPTALFMKCRYGLKAAKTFHTSSFHAYFELGGVQLSFVPAGHMLGSAMLKMFYKGVTYLYSGDFKLQEDETCEKIEFVTADVLITECTYAQAGQRHPDVSLEIKKIESTSLPILLGAYVIGKAQRLLHLIHTHCPEKRVLLHHGIMPYAKLYETMGKNLGTWEPFNRKLIKNKENHVVYLTGPYAWNSLAHKHAFVPAFASGMEKLQAKSGIYLYVSDHADWYDILKLIAQVNPQEIWTLHGDGHALRTHFKNTLPVKML